MQSMAWTLDFEKNYSKHISDAINSAQAGHRRGKPFRAHFRKHGTPIPFLCYRARNLRMKPQEGQTVLHKDKGKFMTDRVASRSA